MSTQFDQVFDGLSKKSLSLEDACRALYSELQASPDSMRVCCERIEVELSRGRITSDAAQLLLDALGEHGVGAETHEAARHEAESDEAQVDEVWVDVPLEPVAGEAPRKGPGETITEVDLTMDDLLAALDRRGSAPAKPIAEVDFDVGDELAAPVEWVEWEPELEAAAEPAVIAEPAVAAPLDTAAAAPGEAAESLAGADPNIALELEAAATPVLNGADAAVAELETAALPETAAAADVEQTPAEARNVEQATATIPPPAVPELSESFVDAFAEIEAAALEVAAAPQQTESESQAEPVAEAVASEHASETVAEPEAVTQVQLDAEAAEEPIIASLAIDQVEPMGEIKVVPHVELAQLEPIFATDPASAQLAATMAAGFDIAPVLATEPKAAEVAAPVPRVEHLLRESTPPQVGALINGRYRIVGTLEPGGLGPLWDAIDTLAQGEPRVTLKLIEVDWQEEPRAFETLQAVVRHVRRLRHPNLLSILDIDRDQGHAILALEPLQGHWLSSLVREVRGRGVGYPVAWNILAGIANGLAYAHQHGSVHAELNPHMVFLTDTGAVKIAGFGLARALPMSDERLDVLDGLTLRNYADAYSATHWVNGSTAEAVDDLYPLGVMAYELLTGAHPFRRLSPTAAAAEQLRPSPIPGLDRRIRRVIERCLSFNRQERPVSGASFLAHVQPADELLDLVRERFNRPVADA